MTPTRMRNLRDQLARRGTTVALALLIVALLAVFADFGAAPAAAQVEPSAAVEAGTPADTAAPDAAEAAPGDEAHAEGGVPDVALVWVLPFVLLLGSIAIMPLVNMHFWEHHYPKFALTLGAVTAGYYLFFFDDPNARGAWVHEMQEYVSFIALLGSLYMVSGGIVIHVSRRATATTNTILLLVGAVIANVVGTTGAAMLLIRPFIRINRKHIKPYHIIFFIFIVANCGGALTPIGDPPLFMGYLKGVPFFWVLEACWPMWAVAVGLLLVVFHIIDRRDHEKTEREHERDAGPAVEIFGFANFLFISVILIAVFQESMFHMVHEGHYLSIPFSREVLMFAAAIGSKLTTKPYIYERNEFTYGPIREVAILFIGIFSTMVPALNYLNKHSGQMPLKSPSQYYFLTGTLSAFLDNAPTYLVFLETKQGQVQEEYGHRIDAVREHLNTHAPGQEPQPLTEGSDEMQAAFRTLVHYNHAKVEAGEVTDADIRIAAIISSPKLALYLIGISIGAVFFGAMTYIGNGPNFMVKSIAESAGIQMPSFFGYLFRYAVPILLPICIVIWLIFFVLLPGV